MEETRKRHAVTANEDNKLRVKKLLTEAVTLLCKNSITYGAELNIEGLLGITVDASDVYLVNINETVRNDANTEPDYNSAEDSDACFAKRWHRRLHTSPRLRNKHRQCGGSTTAAVEDNQVADNDLILIKTERIDEDIDVADTSTYDAAPVSEDLIVSGVSPQHSGLTTTTAASRTFEASVDFSASPIQPCTIRYSSVTEAPEPVPCATQEHTGSINTVQSVNLHTNDFPEATLSTAHFVGISNNVQALADVSKPNIVQSLPSLLRTANVFPVHHGPGDIWSEQRNIETDNVWEAKTSQFLDGPVACPISSVKTNDDIGVTEKTLFAQTSSETTDLCNNGKKQTIFSASQTHRRLAAYTYCPMTCKVCGRVLRNKTIYSRHVKTHMGCLYSCHVCSRKFNRKDSLKRHYFMLHKYDMWSSSNVEQCVI